MARTEGPAVSSCCRLKLREPKDRVFNCPKRFRVLVAGRRFGKTELALIELLRAAIRKRDAAAWYLAPTYRQAKRIAWGRLKQLTRPWWGAQPNETDLRVTFTWGSTIALRGADR